MKVGREHRVPLTDAAIDILMRMRPTNSPSPSAFVFPGRGELAALSTMSLLMTLKRMGRADLTTHGFRSTFRDWAAEQTDFPREVAEAALAHTVGNGVEAAYRRGDFFQKRRALMEAWSSYCDGVRGQSVSDAAERDQAGTDISALALKTDQRGHSRVTG
jgi:integrase